MGLLGYTKGKNLFDVLENRQATAIRLRDYARIGQKLALQRIIIYSAAVLLAGFYYSSWVAIFFFVAILALEVYDGIIFRYILRIEPDDTESARKALEHIFIATFLSAVTIALFCISISIQQGVGGNYFLPVFIMISASIFAAMNNNQFLSVLGLRLTIYVVAILFIPIRDVWSVDRPVTSEVWLNFFTVLFVLGFIFELARSFLTRYSARLKSREALQLEHKQTLVAIEAKKRFLATVSHELRTPLTSIKGSLDILNSGATGPVPEKISRLLDMAGRNSNRLHDLVNDLLLIQSAEADKFSLSISRVDFGEVVVGTLAAFASYAEKLGVEIKSDVRPNEFFIIGDAKRLEQVVANLLSNAAKFSNTDGVIKVEMVQDGSDVVLSVADTGIGIPDGSEAKIFEDFGQIDSSDQRKFEGSGLGLSISRRIIAAHGGKIDYDSKLGEGSTFRIRLKAENNKDKS